METVKVIDYAYPAMMAEKALREMHNSALEKNWCEAREHALKTIKWAAEAHAALLVMQDKDR